MKLEEIVGFSLGFMLRKPKSLVFFIPLFLLNMMAGIATYFVSGDLMTNQREYAALINSAILSGNVMDIFMVPQIQAMMGVSLLLGILSWILVAYVSICIYRAAESEHIKNKWKVMEILKKSIGFLPKYLLLLIIFGIITIIPALLILIPTIILAIVSQLGLLNGVILGLFGLLMVLLFGIPAVMLIVYLAVRLCVALPALVIEGKGIRESLKRSWSLTGGCFWYVLGHVVLFFIIMTVISMALSVPVAIIGSAEAGPYDTGCQPGPLFIISNLLGQLIGFYTTAVWAVFIYMIYLSLVERGKKKPTVQ